MLKSNLNKVYKIKLTHNRFLRSPQLFDSFDPIDIQLARRSKRGEYRRQGGGLVCSGGQKCKIPLKDPPPTIFFKFQPLQQLDYLEEKKQFNLL